MTDDPDKGLRWLQGVALHSEQRAAPAELKARDGISESDQIRRAVKAWMDRKSVTKAPADMRNIMAALRTPASPAGDKGTWKKIKKKRKRR